MKYIWRYPNPYDKILIIAVYEQMILKEKIAWNVCVVLINILTGYDLIFWPNRIHSNIELNPYQILCSLVQSNQTSPVQSNPFDFSSLDFIMGHKT